MRWHGQAGAADEGESKCSFRRHHHLDVGSGIKGQHWSEPGPVAGIESVGLLFNVQLKGDPDDELGFPELQPDLVVNTYPAQLSIDKLE